MWIEFSWIDIQQDVTIFNIDTSIDDISKKILLLQSIPDSTRYSLSDIEAQLSAAKQNWENFIWEILELSKKIIRAKIEYNIRHLQAMPESSGFSISDIEKQLLWAQASWVDVEDLVWEMPKLLTTIMRAKVEYNIRYLQAMPESSIYSIAEIEAQLLTAKQNWVDVEDLIWELPELSKVLYKQ